MFSYRKEIDGLRALAVVPVLLFHAGFSIFSGGFIGVDIFFVISGYLISSIILSEHSRGSFSFGSFYKRRVRRILPALFLIIFACLPAAWLLMPPSSLESFALSIISVVLFISNFWFFSQSGYFTIISEEMPLLHTWSLAVEEQFYIFFPIFLIFFLFLGKKWLLITSICVFIFSLMISQFGENLSTSYPFFDNKLKFSAIPSYAFFLAPTRFFELMVGFFCAYYLFYTKKVPSHDFLSFFGLSVLILCIIFYDNNTDFPGFMALIPVTATALIILFCSDKSVIGRVLSNKILVFIGLISYSTYLWHQPLFSFSRLAMLNEPSNLFFILLILTSFILAFITYRLIESPFRKNLNIPMYGYFLTAILLISLGFLGYYSEGFKSRFDEFTTKRLDTATDLAKLSPPYLCHQKFIDNVNICEFGDRSTPISTPKKVLLLGNSHARMLIPALDEIFMTNNIVGYHPSQLQSCKYDMPFRSKLVSKEEFEKCLNDWKQMLIKISMPSTPVVISHRLTSFITGEYFINSEGFVEQGYRKNFKNYSNEEIEQNYNYALQVYEWIIKYYENVILIYPVPEVGFNVPKAIFLEEQFSKAINYSTSYNHFLRRNSISISLLDNFLNYENVHQIYPSKNLCNIKNIGRCEVLDSKKIPYYYDSNHLTPLGTSLFSNEIISILANVK